MIASILIIGVLSNKVDAQVSLAFTSGYLGTQGSNTNQADGIKKLSTLGISRVSFGQSTGTTFGGTQGNDLSGVIKIYLTSGRVITLNGALNWRETVTGNVVVFGFIFDPGQNASFTYGTGQTFNIVGGSVASSSTTLGLKAYAAALTFVDGENRSGNAATSGLLAALNTELTSSPQPTSIALTSPSVVEGQSLVYTVTLSAAPSAGNPQTFTFSTSGTASKGVDYNSSYTFSNGVVNNGDGTITVPAGVSSFTVTISTTDDVAVEPIENLVLNIGSKSGLGIIGDNDTPTFPICDVNNPYDKIISGYHQSIAQKTDASFSVWGEDLNNAGSGNVLAPLDIKTSNFPNLVGTPLRAAIGGQGGGGKEQAILLTTDGLYAWGNEGYVLDNTLTTSSTFAKILTNQFTASNVNTSTGLPTGVNPYDVKMMTASYGTLVILTNTGDVWTLSLLSGCLNGNGSATAAPKTWYKVKTNSTTYLSDITAVRVQASTSSINAVIALKSDGTVYTWGASTYLGDASSVAVLNYATQMTLPSEFSVNNIPKMIAVTGGVKNSASVKNSYFILSNSGALYSLGYNAQKQLGDFTTTERTSWVNAKINSTTNFSNVTFISAQEHDASFPGVAAVTKNGDLYTWGENEGLALGRTTDGTFYDPGMPLGFNSGSDIALSAELGGHTLVYIKQGTSQFCYVGHKKAGSMGDGDATDTFINSFNCTGTPSLSICGSVPVSASLITSVISANPTTINADGTSTSAITVQLKQSNGTNLTTTGGTVEISTTKGSIGSVTDNNDGTYSAVLTSSTNNETANLSYTLNGNAGTNTATVNFVLSAPTPTITTSGTLLPFTNCSGCTVNAKSFTISGTSLTNDVVVTAPTGFQVSTSAGSGFATSITLTQASGTLTTTTVYVKLANNATTASNGTISLASTGATTGTITVTTNTDNALYLDGVNDNVTAPDNNALDFGTGNFTAEIWVKPDNFSSRMDYFDKKTSAGVNDLSIFVGTDAKVEFFTSTSSGNETFFLSNSTLTAGKWNHIAIVRNGTSHQIYINGVLDASLTGTARNISSTGLLHIGDNSGSFFTKGSVDELRFWNTARTAAEISGNMYSELLGNETGLVAYYPFNQGTIAGSNTGLTTLNDLGPNAINGTLNNIALTGTSSNYVTGVIMPITGATSVNVGNTITLSNPYTGGVWSTSDATIAAIDASTGLVSGIGAGTVTITYTICSKVVTTTMTVLNGCYGFDVADFTMNGNATLLSDNTTVRLTQALGNQNGSIWNRNKINLDYDFDISTSVNLGNSNAGADGIAFVLQNQSVNAGSTGGGLGYQGITPSFAVEFDTYFNGGADPGTGADHIAIVKNGNAANIAAHSEFATPFEVEMEDGLWHDVRFVWTAATKNFKVYWNGSNTPLFNITQDLKANIFNNSSNVYFGLTAATGGAVNVQQVKVPSYCLVKQVSITPKAGYQNAAAATTICAPATVVLEASSSVSYLWYKDGVAMTDSTARSIIVSTSGVYKVVAVDGRGISSTSADVTVTVGNAVAGTITANAAAVCANVNSTLLTLTGSTGNIQWQSSTNGTTFTNIIGANAGTYTATNLTASTYYRAAVTSSSCSANSGTVSITVTPISVAGTISGSRSVCTGTNSSVLTLSGSTGSIQWQSSSDNVTYTDITGETGTTYTATNLTATTYYKAVVTNGICSAATNTNPGTITVSPASVAGAISGGDVSVCLGSANSTTMTLSGYTGTIQWQSSSDNVNFTNISGATSASYTASNLAVTTYYKAVVTSGACSLSATTSVAITVSQCIVANPDINTTNVNTPVTGSVNTNDKTTSGTTYGPYSPASTNPSGGTLTLNSNGTYTFNASLPGRYIYYIQVCGAGQTTGCAVAPLEITVTDPNSTSNPPIVKNDYTTTQVNTPVNVRVLSNDRVVNAGTSLLPSTVIIIAAPNNGTASVNSSTGVVTFTPNTGFTGTDSLNYKVCDNSTSSNCQIATVYFKISSSSIAEYTTADDDFNNVNMNSTVSGNVLTNDINSANNTLTVTSNSTPLSTQGTIRINADGSYTFTPTANFFGPVDITYTACTNASVCATATLHILVSPVKPAAPTVTGGTYVSKDPTNPANIGSTVSNIPTGSKAIYCDVNGLSCSTTTPVIPLNPGIYVWCVKSLDTITNLTSSPCVYDTITVLPYVKVVNATYVNGVATNPKNIAGLISEISAGSIAKWCNVAGTSCTTTAPSLPTTIGKTIWCVKAIDTASGLSSIVCKMDTVTILDPYTVMELSKSATSVKLNPDGTILLNFVMKAINKTDASIDSVSIKDDLTRTFNTSRGILVYSLDAYGGLVKNVGFDGIANIELLDPSSKLAAKKTDSVVLKVLLESPDVSGTLNNTATMTGKTKYGKFSVVSNDPLANPSDSTIRIATSFKVPKVDVIVAGGFSPNQDGMNDKWIIVRPFGTIIHVKVFNRWGNLVYENENYTNDWDGRGQGNFMGQYLPEGTYFYMVEATDASGNVQKFAKSLTIVR